jgi:hypothetical protein
VDAFWQLHCRFRFTSPPAFANHASPESARMGLDAGQLDPGWRALALLQRCGLVTRINTPRQVDLREDLEASHRGVIRSSI